jgi:signal transduction histidine kinase
MMRNDSGHAVPVGDDRLGAVLDGIGQAICLTDAGGKYLYVTPEMAALINRRSDDILGVLDEEVLPERIRPDLVELRRRVLKSGKRETAELVFEIDGVRATHLVSYSPVAGDDGGIVGIISNIGEWRAAEASLRSSFERFRSLFDLSPVGLAELDLSGLNDWIQERRRSKVGEIGVYLRDHPDVLPSVLRKLKVVNANPAMTLLLGGGSGKEPGRELERIFLAESLDAARQAILAYVEGRTFFETEGVYRTFDGRHKSIFVTYSIVPDAKAVGTHAFIAAVDLTDVKRAREEVEARRLDRERYRMEMLSATGRLASGIAHEINNPLQGIKAQMRLLSDDLPPDTGCERRLALISKEVDRIARIVAQMLSLHQEPPSDGATCSVYDVMDEITSFLESRSQQLKVSFSAQVDPKDLRVPMGRENLFQALLNLCMNALDAMPDGGSLRIEGTREDREAVVRVQDTGQGIPEEDLSRVIAPFFTTKGPQGTGLGLPMVHSLVKNHGGRLELASSLGCGTTVALRFPTPTLAADLADSDGG